MHRCWCYSSPSFRDAAEIAVLLLGPAAQFLQIPALLLMASFACGSWRFGGLDPALWRTAAATKDFINAERYGCGLWLVLLSYFGTSFHSTKLSTGGVGVALHSSVFGVKVSCSSASALVQINLIVLCMLQMRFYGIWGFLWAFSLFLVLWLWQLAPWPFGGAFFYWSIL